jgi:hypothetical protein
MNPTIGKELSQFHLCLKVADLPRSVEFYATLFDRKPARLLSEYAQIVLTSPPLILSLLPRSPAGPAAFGSLGLRMPDRQAVLDTRERIERAGVKTHVQECTRCGYTEQLRVHVSDPDRNFWSLYAIARHVDPRAIRQSLEGPAAFLPSTPGENVWEHPLSRPDPERIPHPDDSLDEIRLASGTGPAALLADALRALRPGGQVQVHAWLAERPSPGDRTAGEAVALLNAAGFRGVQILEGVAGDSGPTPDGRSPREACVVGYKPRRLAPKRDHVVLYKGPFRQTRDDLGNLYPRGHRVAVDALAWDLLRRGTAAEHFVFYDPNAHPTAAENSSVN